MKKTIQPSRREFLAAASTAAVLRPSRVRVSTPAEVKTIQDVIDLLKAMAAQPPPPTTVDTVKTGDPRQPIRGIVTTFMPNCGVIEEARRRGANLIVTHEPTFYTHEDLVDWLEEDPTYRYKRRLAEDNGIVIWRFHDYQHRIDPDPVMQAMVARLDWARFASGEDPRIFEIPGQTVSQVIDHVKRSLGPPAIRLVGDPQLECRRVGILLGSPGARGAIRFLGQNPVDLAIAGEVSSWETAEYVRDTIHSGHPMALIVAGHAASEEPGMAWLEEVLREKLPGIPVHHVPGENPYLFF